MVCVQGLTDAALGRQGDVGPDVAASKIGKSGNSLASRRSTHDTDIEVRSEESKDLKKSMQEALVDYKKLLKHEVKKEEMRTVSDPTLAIETPVGKPLLPTLSGGDNENPAKLEMDALKGETSTAKVGVTMGGTEPRALCFATFSRCSSRCCCNTKLRVQIHAP